jgi:cell division septum initiation protein DivIVA
MLAMALVGYELEKKKIDERIREVRAQLAGGAINGDTPKRRKLSVAARKRIAAAQKKRWAEHRKALAQGRPT